MKTVVENINNDVDNLKELFEDFFLDHSDIYYDSQISPRIIIGMSDYSWGELSNEGKQIQTRLLKEYREFIDLVSVLIQDVSENSKTEFKENSDKVLSYIEQNQQVWLESTQEVLEEVIGYIDKQKEIVKSLYDLNKGGSVIIVPDTNALLSNPNIEGWSFDNISCMELLLVPTVSSELDKLKVFHNNNSVREKSKKIIRRINEYRRRGTLIKGVPVVKNKIYIRAIAVEPDFSISLPWLDIENNDDRILASFIEIMRLHPNSQVILVTNDLNLQNKAEFARIPWMFSP